MEEYKIETVHVMKKYAVIMVEAQSESQAIEKARAASDEEFLERESIESTQWQVKKASAWASFMALFVGR